MIIINDTIINKNHIVSIAPLTKVLAKLPIEVDVSDPIVDAEPTYEIVIKNTYFIGVLITMVNGVTYEIGRKHIAKDNENTIAIETDASEYVRQVGSLIWQDEKIKTIQI